MLEGTDELLGWLKVGGGARSKGRAMKEGGIGLGICETGTDESSNHNPIKGRRWRLQ